MKRALTSIHGKLAGFASTGEIVNQKGFVAGDKPDQIAFPAPDRLSFTDQFLVPTLNPFWAYTEGTDTATADKSVSGGVLTITSGDSAGTIAADGAMINQQLMWKAANGDMCMSFQIALGVITSVSMFAGFTDTLALEQPIQSASSADTFTTTATDAVGIMFDTNMTNDTWWLTGVANDVDATMQNTAIAPVAATYEKWRIDLSTAGAATFYRNNVQIGTTMSGAVTPTIALTPVFIIRPLSAVAGRTILLKNQAHISGGSI